MAEWEIRRGRDWGYRLPDAEQEGVSVGGRWGEGATGQPQVVSGLSTWVLVMPVLR